MNLIEALTSGKRFKRPCTGWYSDISKLEWLHVSIKSLLADDWEVEEQSVPITRTTLSDAFKKARENQTGVIEYYGVSATIITHKDDLEDLVAKELGL